MLYKIIVTLKDPDGEVHEDVHAERVRAGLVPFEIAKVMEGFTLYQDVTLVEVKIVPQW